MPHTTARPDAALDVAGDGTSDDARALLTLASVPGVGPARVRALLARLGDAASVLNAHPRTLAQVEGIGMKTARAIVAFDGAEAIEAQLRQAEQVGARLLTLTDPAFPRALLELYDPPPYLWVRGALRPEDARAVAIVGTRKASAYGKRVAAHFAAGLVERGYTIVSGLAYGIDIAAHRAALDAGGRTLAVLGSGVDRIYPQAHTAVVRRIIEHEQGAVLSEFPLGTKPDAPNFPRRNRIIAGLTLGTLVAEARVKGGALLTAYAALEQNREVFAAPIPLFHNGGEGNARLVQRGHAKLVASVDDLVAEIESQQIPSQPATAQQLAPAFQTNRADSLAPSKPPPTDLNRVEQQLYDALSAEPIHLDVLCERSGVDVSNALVYLLGLELKGHVGQLAGRQFFRR
ncbi:MAG: DNA-processing protein DprA [Bacteroidota bacterium]